MPKAGNVSRNRIACANLRSASTLWLDSVSMLKATEIKKGDFLRYENQLQMVLETDHVKPGKGPAYVQAKMKNMETGTIKFNRINSSDKVEDVEIERRTLQYLYDASGQGKGPFVFMNNETFEQVEIGSEVIPRE